MKLNNKGITLTEIIISIALISVVLIFLFSLLVTVNDINKESEVNSTYLINKSLILKNIESDLSKINPDEGITLRTCAANDIYSGYNEFLNSLSEEDKKIKGASECIVIDYDNNASTENAKLGIYYYNNRDSYVISYIYGNVKATRLLPDFEKYNVDKTTGEFYDNMKMKIKLGSYSSCGSDLSRCNNTEEKEFTTITIPIIGEDEKDYSIIISYYGIVSIS